MWRVRCWKAKEKRKHNSALKFNNNILLFISIDVRANFHGQQNHEWGSLGIWWASSWHMFKLRAFKIRFVHISYPNIFGTLLTTLTHSTICIQRAYCVNTYFSDIRYHWDELFLLTVDVMQNKKTLNLTWHQHKSLNFFFIQTKFL